MLAFFARVGRSDGWLSGFRYRDSWPFSKTCERMGHPTLFTAEARSKAGPPVDCFARHWNAELYGQRGGDALERSGYVTRLGSPRHVIGSTIRERLNCAGRLIAPAAHHAGP